MIKILCDGEEKVLSPEEEAEFTNQYSGNKVNASDDKVDKLAEGLSTANTLAQVRAAAKEVLGGE